MWTDGSRNWFAASQKEVSWINVRTAGDNPIKAQIAIPSASPPLNTLTLATILNVGLSRDKAVILKMCNISFLH